MTSVTAASAEQNANRAIGAMHHIGSVVGGDLIDQGATSFEVVDPTTEQVIAAVPEASIDLVDAAVRSAREAFEAGPWPRMSPEERATILRRLAELIVDNTEVLSNIATAEAGTPVTWSRFLHAGYGAEFFQWWGDMAIRGPRGGYRQPLGIQIKNGVASDSILRKEPIGVMAGILAYNAPLVINSFKLGGALAAGCTAVLLPSPDAPLSTIEFMRLVREAGIPDGVVNLVAGREEVGRALSSHPGVDLVSFTGSLRVGRQVMTQAAQNISKVVLELGGKSPSIILPGANLSAAVQVTLKVLTTNTGQQCGAPSRIFVPRAQLDDFLDLARVELTNTRVGDPWDPTTDVGPVISRRHVDTVNGYIERAVDAGGEILAQGQLPDGVGCYLAPALVGGLSNDAELCREELFAPIGAVLPYDDVEDAVQDAHDNEYGLNALVWGPMEEAMSIAERMQSGSVTINGGGLDRPDATWAGYKHSGLGAERGEDGFAEYFVTKHISWPVTMPH